MHRAETRTNTPLQALNLMNDVTYVEARKFAERILTEGGVIPAKRCAMLRLALGALKTGGSTVLLTALSQFQTRFGPDTRAADALLREGESPIQKNLDPAELAAYTGIASLILNLDETVTKE
jgi:hypothetical protein